MRQKDQFQTSFLEKAFYEEKPSRVQLSFKISPVAIHLDIQ